MSKKKTTKKPKASWRESIEGADVEHVLAKAARMVTGLLFVALAAAWILGRGPLIQSVKAVSSDPLVVRFEWPSAGDAGDATWLPVGVREGLEQIVLATVSMDPFDYESLDRSRKELLATGWFEEIQSVRRAVGGEIHIDGSWRAPAAVVVKDRKAYVVGHGAELLWPAHKGSIDTAGMYVITEPGSGPPLLAEGRVGYGIAWRGGEVQPAIALLRAIADLEGGSRIVGVDLSNYQKSGHLVLVTDTGCRLTWGSPIGELGPGQVTEEVRLSRLSTILAQRLDVAQAHIDIHLPRAVLIDRTVSGG